MPYWSSSRVGAVPTGQPSKQKKRTERYNRKKGITMEDLKKQTALRLAKEQQQSRSTNGYHGANTQERTVVQRHNPTPTEPPPVSQSPVPFHPSQAPDDSRPFNSLHNGGLLPSYRFEPNNIVPRRDEQNLSTPVKQSARFNAEQTRSAPHPSKSSSSDASGQRPKLPHGLTVSELKEMTKARLQAEASEKRENNSPEPLGPIPTIVRASPEYRDRHARSPIMSSPAPSYRRSPYPDHMQPSSHETWSHDSRNDVWETGSVSTQTSDYVGSDHAFGITYADENGYSNRARSFSASSGIGVPHEFGPSREVSSPSVSHPMSYFDTGNGFVPNRRRAATLSPRLGLSHLHEDRPVLTSQEPSGVPSFVNANHHQQHHLHQLTHSIAPRVGMSSSDHLRFQNGSIFGDSYEGNRARTSSAVSLPAISHTAEEFAVEYHNSGSRLAPFGILPEESTSVTGLSDVFRDPGAPPGFIGAPRMNYSETFSEPRLRASTWGATTSTSDLFGPSLIRGTMAREDSLADDLALILKLSGAEERVSPPPGLI